MFKEDLDKPIKKEAKLYRLVTIPSSLRSGLLKSVEGCDCSVSMIYINIFRHVSNSIPQN